MEKKGKKRRWKRWERRVVATAFCGVFFGGVALQSVKIGEKIGIIKGEETRTSGWKNGGVGGNERILPTPAAETRLSVCDLRPGDLLAARWEDEERNGTPGFWNHLAIVGADGSCVVEAQKSADGVVTASINDFLARYSEICVVRFFNSETARRAAVFAESRVAVEEKSPSPPRPNRERNAAARENGVNCEEKEGRNDEKKTRLSGPRYSWSASLAPILREDAATENCVSLVRRAFWRAAGVDYRWRTPDDLARWDESGDFAKMGRL